MEESKQGEHILQQEDTIELKKYIHQIPKTCIKGDYKEIRQFFSLYQITATFPKQWFNEQQQTTVPSLEALARFLATLALNIQRSCAGCPEAEKKKARYFHLFI